MGNAFKDILSRYFPPRGIGAIQSIKIGIAGLGGLGSNCAMNLARCGFERFVLADFDSVEPSNLNRQAYLPGHIGRLKTDCLGEMLRTLNPDLAVESHQVRLDEANLPAIFGGCDVIVEAFDRPECKALIIGAFMHSGKLLVGASGLAGYGESDRIVTRKVNDDFYLIGDAVSEVNDNLKPYAPCVAIAAAKQADVVLSWVLKKAGKDNDANG
jgi:sulfur carrier protein ThiS adenylyltransferase